MMNFSPAIRRHSVLGQVGAAAAPAPVVVQAPAQIQTTPIVNLLGWSVVGFASGAATGYAVGKGLLGHKGTGLMDGLIGGIGGTVAALVSRLL